MNKIRQLIKTKKLYIDIRVIHENKKGEQSMTFILVDTSFNAFDTNPKNGKLDKEEVAAAHAKGCVWAKEGQTAIEYQQAKADYDAAKKEESWKKLTEAGNQPLDSIFTKLQDKKVVKHHIY